MSDLDRAARRLLAECIKAFRREKLQCDWADWSLQSAAEYLLQEAEIDPDDIPTDEELSRDT